MARIHRNGHLLQAGGAHLFFQPRPRCPIAYHEQYGFGDFPAYKRKSVDQLFETVPRLKSSEKTHDKPVFKSHFAPETVHILRLSELLYLCRVGNGLDLFCGHAFPVFEQKTFEYTGNDDDPPGTPGYVVADGPRHGKLRPGKGVGKKLFFLYGRAVDFEHERDAKPPGRQHRAVRIQPKPFVDHIETVNAVQPYRGPIHGKAVERASVGQNMMGASQISVWDAQIVAKTGKRFRVVYGQQKRAMFSRS